MSELKKKYSKVSDGKGRGKRVDNKNYGKRLRELLQKINVLFSINSVIASNLFFPPKDDFAVRNFGLFPLP